MSAYTPPPRILFAITLLALLAGSFAIWMTYGPGPWGWRDVLAIAWFPLGMVYVWVMSEIGARKRAKIVEEQNLTLLPSHVRQRRLAAVLLLGLIVAGQAVIVALAYRIIGENLRETAARGLLVALGLAMALLGDRRAKMQSPYRGGVPEPEGWGKMQRRAGWILTLIGLALIPCALLLPLVPVTYGYCALMIALLLWGWIARRSLRKPAG